MPCRQFDRDRSNKDFEAKLHELLEDRFVAEFQAKLRKHGPVDRWNGSIEGSEEAEEETAEFSGKIKKLDRKQ